MSTYHNSTWGFDLQLPAGWREPGGIARVLLFFRYAAQSSQPEFYGPDGASLKFAIGPISPEPSAEMQQRTLQHIAMKRGEDVLDVGTVQVGGRIHATMTVDIPYVGRVKHYSLIFRGTEYLVSARAPENVADSIVSSFRLR
jgi:hypothetical protein